jgi:hypothetical protein
MKTEYALELETKEEVNYEEMYYYFNSKERKDEK